MRVVTHKLCVESNTRLALTRCISMHLPGSPERSLFGSELELSAGFVIELEPGIRHCFGHQIRHYFRLQLVRYNFAGCVFSQSAVLKPGESRLVPMFCHASSCERSSVSMFGQGVTFHPAKAGLFPCSEVRRSALSSLSLSCFFSFMCVSCVTP